jgi:hypothetical protein
MVPHPRDAQDQRVVAELGDEGRQCLMVTADRHPHFDNVGDVSGRDGSTVYDLEGARNA